MLIGSPLYCVLLIPLVVSFYWLRTGRHRLAFLFLASWAYYLTFPTFFVIAMIFIVGVAYFGAVLIERSSQTKHATLVAYATMMLCAAPLLFFKYLLPAVIDTTRPTATNWEFTASQLILPIGLSFYTFAALGYLIDVAIGILSAERNFFKVGLFCNFFPHVTAGPIPRASSFMPQLTLLESFSAIRGKQGVSEILVGVTMKFCIADALEGPVSAVYSDINSLRPIELFVGSIFFAFQLYADFAGYSLIALGTARLFSIQIIPNFRQPFLASSIADFWRGWHISLFSWLRDYVFTPMRAQFRRRGAMGTYLATVITLVLVGVWHGAGWGFVVFGAVHGALIVAGQITQRVRDSAWSRLNVRGPALQLVRIPTTFVIVCLTFVLFRARDLGQARDIYGSIFSLEFAKDIGGIFSLPNYLVPHFKYITFQSQVVPMVALSVLIIGDIVGKYTTDAVYRWPYPARAALYSVGVLTLLYQAVSVDAEKPFAYFQF